MTVTGKRPLEKTSAEAIIIVDQQLQRNMRHLGVTSSSSSYWLVAAGAAVAAVATAEARLALNKDPKTVTAKQQRQLLQEKMANQRKASASQLPPSVRTSIRSLSELTDMVHDNQGSTLDERGLFETHKVSGA